MSERNIHHSEKLACQQEKLLKRPEPSRRKFLGLFAGALAIEALGVKRKPIVEAQETGTDIYHKGILKARQSSWDSPREQLYVYKRKRDGIETFQKINEGKATFIYIPIQDMQEAYNEDIEAIEEIHTHPLSFMYPEFSDRDKARAGALPLRAMPPSLMDVGGAISAIDMLGESAKKVTFKAADPGRIWTYAPDNTHAFFKHVIRIQKEMLSLGLWDREDVQSYIKKNELENEDPRIVQLRIARDRKEFNEATQKMIERSIALEKEFFMDENARRILAIENSSPRGLAYEAPELQELIKSYAALGVRISFTPYE